jgi:hypothetical protein
MRQQYMFVENARPGRGVFAVSENALFEKISRAALDRVRHQPNSTRLTWKLHIDKLGIRP